MNNTIIQMNSNSNSNLNINIDMENNAQYNEYIKNINNDLINNTIDKNTFNKNIIDNNNKNTIDKNTIDKNTIDKNIIKIKNTNILNKICNIYNSEFYNDFNKNIETTQYDYNKLHLTSNNHIFKNVVVQKLYDILHSVDLSLMKNTTEIYYVLNPLIQNVINNEEAYSELYDYNVFTPIIEHIDNDKKYFKKMDFAESMSFALWMNVYH